MDLEIVISSASAGRALRGLSVTPRGKQEELIPHVSKHILLELPQGSEEPITLMAPDQPSKSFIACFSTLENSLTFREDVISRGWTAATSLHLSTNILNFIIDLETHVDSSVTSTSTFSRNYHIHDNISQICFIHCRFVPKKCFQIPPTKMRLCRDALAQACKVDNHCTASNFLDIYHSHVSTELYYVGGIFFHELTIRSEGHNSIQQMLEAAQKQFQTNLGIESFLLSSNIEVSSTSNTMHNSTTSYSSKVHKFQETTTTLGPVCDTNDPTEFLRKLEEDSSSWVIIDKKPDQAHSLVSVWQIIDNQLQAFAADPTKVECLRKSTRYMSKQWQDDIESSRLHREHPMISQLLQTNADFQRATTMATTSTLGNLLSLETKIPQLPEKMSLPQLLEQLHKLMPIGNDTMLGPSASICNQAATLIKYYIQNSERSQEWHSSAGDLFREYGFQESNGNVLETLDISQLDSLVSDLDTMINRGQDDPQPLDSGGRRNKDFTRVCLQKYSAWPTATLGAAGSYSRCVASLTYAWDVVVDRPFLPNVPPAPINEQAKRVLDCLKHRVDVLPHLSRIRGGAATSMAAKNSSSWSDDDDDDDDDEEDLDEEEEHVQVSPLDLIIHLLRISDVPTQVAIYGLLLEQRAAIPLVHVSATSPQHKLQHHAQALSYVDVKLARQNKLILTRDTELPRVVFASNKRVSESRAAIVASSALCCNFMSLYNRNDMAESPVVEVGLGFLRPGQVQAGRDEEPQPCLAFHINGRLHENPCMIDFVKAIADVIVLELGSKEEIGNSEMLRGGGSGGQKMEMLQWVFDGQERQDKRKKLILGGETYIAKQTAEFLRHFFQGKLLPSLNQTSNHLDQRKTLEYVCVNHLDLSNPDLYSFKQHEMMLSAVDFASVKQAFSLQESFNRESSIQFEILKLKDNPAETRKKQNSCEGEKRRRAVLIPNAMENNVLIHVFHHILTMPDATARRVGMMWLDRAIAEQMRPLMKEAETKKDNALNQWDMNYGNTELRDRHLLLKQHFVDGKLGIGNLWREICHMFLATSIRKLAKLAALHLLDAFPLEILDGDAGMFCTEWVQTVLAELDTLTSQELKRPARICVLSVMGLQSSGKSTLLNLMFGTQLHVSAGRCTRGVYLQVVKSERPQYDYLFLLDTEGIRSPEFYGLDDSQIRDNRLATFGLLPADASIFMVSNEDDSGLKDVVPMVLLAFKGSRIAESYSNTIRSKMVFVYRSVDTNDKGKLKENKQKLKEHLRMAAEQLRNMTQSGKLSTSSGSENVDLNMMKEEDKMFESMFGEGMHVDEDDNQSDVKCMGNLKRGHTPPNDVPEWEYGKQVIEAREYIHRRVTEDKRWRATTIKEWSKYLSLVWDCICEADFDLSFKTAMERVAYNDLQQTLAKGPRLKLSKKFMEEFEKVESDVRSNNLGVQSRSARAAVFDSNVSELSESLTREVERMLETTMWKKWKDQELSQWNSFCMSLQNDYKHRLGDFMSGVFEFEDEVSRYEVKMKKEIVELIDQGKLDAEKREEVFRGIFNRIVNEAKGKHEPFAERVPISVKNQYGISNLTKMFQLHSHKPTINYSGAPVQLLPGHQASRPRGSDKWTAGNIGKAVWQTFTNLMPTNNGGEGENAQGPHLIEELAAIVNSNVKNVKKYDDVIVMNVIQSTTKVLEPLSREDQESGHRFVMNTLIQRLEEKQREWDKKHNVAERLREAEPQLRGFFEDYANGVGAANMLVSELERLLEAQLQNAHHELLVRVVVDNLANKSWMINSDAMRACLDLHLLTLIQKNMFKILIAYVSDGRKHFQDVTGALIGHECLRLYETEWKSFLRKVQRCLQDAGEKANRRDEVWNKKGCSSVEVFMDELKSLLRGSGVDPSGKLATSILSRISSDQYKDLDVDVVSTKLPELCRNLEQKFCNLGSVLQRLRTKVCKSEDSELCRLVQRVRERMEQLKEERVTMRCHEKCPRCGITCILGAGHAGRHDTVHQPQGLAGVCWANTKALAESNCAKSFQVEDRIVKQDGSQVSYKDFGKEYPTWCDPSNHLHTNSIRVREYIFYNYQYQLVDYFKAHGYRIVKCPPRVMPAFYDHSLDSLWNTIQNKLGDSFSQIEHTLKDMNSS